MQVLQGAAHPFLAATGASAAGPLSASFWLASLGALGVFVVVFAETGLLAGFFLPGDSLLFTAGLYCSASAITTVHLSLGPVLLAAGGGRPDRGGGRFLAGQARRAGAAGRAPAAGRQARACARVAP